MGKYRTYAGISCAIDRDEATYGRLTPLGTAFQLPAGRRGKRLPSVVCECTCGEVVVVNVRNLRCGNTQSCGCLQIDSAKKPRRHGGRTRTMTEPEYHCWISIKRRCVADNQARGAGHREIQICERWSTYANFVADMGRRPCKNSVIVRIEQDLDYCPENCKWATKSEALSNHARTRRLSVEGREATLSQLCREYRVPVNVAQNRLRSGWKATAAFTTPVRHYKRKAQAKE